MSDTREVLLEGLLQALQARVVSVWNNVTLHGEPQAAERFKKGITSAAQFYEQAVKAVEKMEL